MTPTLARQTLADHVKTATGIDAYAAPPDVPPPPPAVVLAPRPTYLTKGTVCTWEQRLSATVAVALVSGVPGIDLLEETVLAVVAALETCPGVDVALDQVDDIGPVQESQGVSYMTAVASVTAYIT